MMVISEFKQLNPAITSGRTYGFALFFIAGNIILPQLCHLFPEGGKIFLPVYFFTLLASYKFGLKVGLLTAILSPLCNHWLFGMPPAGMLTIILIKSSLLAFAGAWVAAKSRSVSLVHLAIVVLVYQIIGGVVEWGIEGNFFAALQDFRLGWPGMLLQVILGWFILRRLAAFTC